MTNILHLVMRALAGVVCEREMVLYILLKGSKVSLSEGA